MKYVLDSNVALKWVLPEPDSAQAVRLRQGFLAGLHELLAPDIYPIEVAHALTKAERQGKILAGEGWPKTTDILTTPPDLHPYLPLLPHAFAIASRARIGVYDCLYVALAEREGCQLVTGDKRLIKNLQPRYPCIVDLASLP
jgi:predicted nucleic acid-binding protein